MPVLPSSSHPSSPTRQQCLKLKHSQLDFYTWDCANTVRELALKADTGRKSLAAPGNQTCISCVPVQSAESHPHPNVQIHSVWDYRYLLGQETMITVTVYPNTNQSLNLQFGSSDQRQHHHDAKICERMKLGYMVPSLHTQPTAGPSLGMSSLGTKSTKWLAGDLWTCDLHITGQSADQTSMAADVIQFFYHCTLHVTPIWIWLYNNV